MIDKDPDLPEEHSGELLSLVYQELHGLATALMKRERANHTLQPTALINEAYLRLAKRHDKAWRDRTHFFATAALCIKKILIDHARNRSAVKRGSGARTATLIEGIAAEDLGGGVDVLDLEDALIELRQRDVRQAKVVELRFYGGLSVEESAQILEVSPRTIKNDWRFARAWLHTRLRPPGQE